MRSGRWTWLLAAVLAGALVVTACGDGAAGDPEDVGGGHPVGVLRLGLEDTEAMFVEGFQLQLGVDTSADGEERTFSWEQLVMDRVLEWPAGVTEQDLGWWYDGVLVLQLPAGEVTVTSRLDVGMEPPGAACSLTFELEPAETRDVRVLLRGPETGCPVAVPTV